MADQTSTVPQFPCNYCGGLTTEQDDGTFSTDNSAHKSTCILYVEPVFTRSRVLALIEDIANQIQENHDKNHFDTIIVSSPDGHLRDAKSWNCSRCLEAVKIVRKIKIGD